MSVVERPSNVRHRQAVLEIGDDPDKLVFWYESTVVATQAIHDAVVQQSDGDHRRIDLVKHLQRSQRACQRLISGPNRDVAGLRRRQHRHRRPGR